MKHLRTRPEGPFLKSEAAKLRQWNAVYWIINRIEEGGHDLVPLTWEERGSAEEVLATYCPAENTETGEITYPSSYSDDKVRIIMVRRRGREALNACIAGEGPSEVMEQWKLEIWNSRKRRTEKP